MDNDGFIEEVIDKEFVAADESKQSFIYDFLFQVINLVQSNGWYILIGCIVIYYLYEKFKNKISIPFNSTQSHHREIDEEKEIKRLQNIEAARQRQQAAMDAAAAKYLEEKRIKEEKLAKERQEDWERHQQGLGYRSKTKKQNDDFESLGLSKPVSGGEKKPKLRDSDYNPLTGQSSSGGGGSCYRPTKRGGAGGG